MKNFPTPSEHDGLHIARYSRTTAHIRRSARILFACAIALPPLALASPQYFIVGATQDAQGGQTHCQYENIQDAIDAAYANGSDLDYIFITSTKSYLGQALTLHDQNLLIDGSYDNCDLAPTDPPPASTAIVGDGAHSVLSIDASNAGSIQIDLKALDISGGGDDGSGGGLDVRDNVFATLSNVRVHDNASFAGGGIYSQPTVQAHGSIVELLAGTRIDHNNASSGSGGGVFAASSQLRMRAENVIIENNLAGSGGGVACLACSMTVGYFGPVTPGVAGNGATIRNNAVGGGGGGLLIGGLNALLDAHELAIDNNTAGGVGGGIYAYGGAQLNMQRDYPNVQSLNCERSDPCTRIRGNTVGNGAPTALGGGIYLKGGSRADLAQVMIADNAAGDGAAAYVESSTFNTESVLFSGNHSADTPSLAGVLIHAVNAASGPPVSLRLAFSTFAGNLETDNTGTTRAAIDLLMPFTGGGGLEIYSSAMYDAVYPLTAYSPYISDCVVHGRGGVLDAHGVNTREAYTGGAGDPPSPGFNNPAAGDYRLRSESFLTDYCDSSRYVPTTNDIVLDPRCVDDPRNTDDYGRCDIGAYESDHLFGNGFE